MTKTNYTYFVSYAYSGGGFGWTTVTCNRPIQASEDILRLGEVIQSRPEFGSGEMVVVLNFQLLNVTEEPQS